MVEMSRNSEVHNKFKLPQCVQGGMGVGVSDGRLASSVAKAGEELGEPVLGVVAGTGLPIIMVDRLQNHDPDTICALVALQKIQPRIVQEIVEEYVSLVPGQKHKLPPKPETLITGEQDEKDRMNRIAVAAAFVEIWLAKQGHNGPIGINLLEKIQPMHLPTLLGAMMAGVDAVFVGAGIPNQIPQILEHFVQGEEAQYNIDVIGSKEKLVMTLDPKRFIPQGRELKKPQFYAIISNHTLAIMLNKKVSGVDGFVVEGPTAGGHNAPARGKSFDELGQPVYGDKDEPDLIKIKELGKPFWLAGGYANGLEKAKQSGATGVQVGTPFALCNESGLNEEAKLQMKAMIHEDKLRVLTSATASPTGYPFQLAQLEGTLTEEEVYKARKRKCDLGYLVQAFSHLGTNDDLVFRCSAEPKNAYVKKGGNPDDIKGSICLCNALVAAVGHGQKGEPAVYTLGKDLGPVKELSSLHPDGNYSAKEVLEYVFSQK